MLTPSDSNPALDAVIAASDFHRVLLENDELRVLEVVVPAGSKEPFHTHQWPSVFIVYGTPRLRYYAPEVSEHLFEIEPQTETGILHLAPEGMHSLENIDTRDLYAFRVEMKQAPASNRVPVRGPVLKVGTPGDFLSLDNDIVKVCRGAMDASPHHSCLQMRRREPNSLALWLESAPVKPFDNDDIIFRLKYRGA